jgi:uncharacterized Zn finger protein (UPF0148 family)
MPGLRCLECGTTDEFELGDGTGYCRVCGTQSQDIREEVVELDETVFSQHNTTVRFDPVYWFVGSFPCFTPFYMLI